MPLTHSFLFVCSIYLAVLASPGPNLFILSQMTLSQRYKEAYFVALGIVTGTVFWVLTCIAGLATLLAEYSSLTSAIQLAGAAYLVGYGGRMLWSLVTPNRRPFTDPVKFNGSRFAAYRVGLITNLTNPKAVGFWTGVFATLLPDKTPIYFYITISLSIIILSLAWHIGIIMLFKLPIFRSIYLRIIWLIKGCVGLTLLILGAQRILEH